MDILAINEIARTLGLETMPPPEAQSLMDMPFLQSIEAGDALAVESLRRITARDEHAVRQIIQHPTFWQNGITDGWTPIIATLWDVLDRNPALAPKLLDPGRVNLESRAMNSRWREPSGASSGTGPAAIRDPWTCWNTRYGMPVKAGGDRRHSSRLLPGVPLIEDIGAEHLLADEACDANEIIAGASARGMNPVIPPRSYRWEGRDYDRALYQLRHLVENGFLGFKQWRRVAIRYAKRTA